MDLLLLLMVKLHPTPEFTAYPASRWLHRHWTAAPLGTPGPGRRSPPALEGREQTRRQITVLGSPAAPVKSGRGQELLKSLVVCAAAACTLLRQGQQRPVLQKPLALDVARDRKGPAGPAHALNDTQTRLKTKKPTRDLLCAVISSAAAARWYLILHRTDGTVIPPIPAGGGGALGRCSWFHWLVQSPLTQEGVQVGGAELFLWRRVCKRKKKKAEG